MTFTFKPADEFRERAGLFVSLTGGTNSGKTFSALRLARGIAGPSGKIAVLDTEGGRTLHLKDQFRFDANVMDAPFRPDRFAEAARAAEEAGYAVLVIDSFTMEWVGMGGVLDWQEQELSRMAGDDYRKRERVKMASWIKPKMAHKAMVYSFLQRRMPIIFSIRGDETVKPGENSGDKPTKIFKSITDQRFPFEVTVSFRLETERKGYIDLSDAKSYKMEGSHRDIFRHGDQIAESHGAALEAWARGQAFASPPPAVSQTAARRAADDDAQEDDPDSLIDRARMAATDGVAAYQCFWTGLSNDERSRLIESGDHDTNKAMAARADAAPPADDFPGDRTAP